MLKIDNVKKGKLSVLPMANTKYVQDKSYTGYIYKLPDHDFFRFDMQFTAYKSSEEFIYPVLIRNIDAFSDSSTTLVISKSLKAHCSLKTEKNEIILNCAHPATYLSNDAYRDSCTVLINCAESNLLILENNIINNECRVGQDSTISGNTESISIDEINKLVRMIDNTELPYTKMLQEIQALCLQGEIFNTDLKEL